MKRILSLLLCAVLLLGLLPGVLAADDETNLLYFEVCDEHGEKLNDRVPSGEFVVGYGETVYFRCYTSDSDTPIKDGNMALIDGSKSDDTPSAALTWHESGDCWRWNTGAAMWEVVHFFAMPDETEYTGLARVVRQAGKPVEIPVTINGQKTTCWMGVGEFYNGSYHTLVNSSMGNLEGQDCTAQLAVGLWRKNKSGDLMPLNSSEAKAVMEQCSFSLTISPQDDQTVSPPVAEEPTAEQVAAGMPCAARYTLETKHEGWWRVEARCTIGEKTYRAYGNLERRLLAGSTTVAGETVEAINEALEDAFHKIESSSAEQAVRVILSAAEYDGQIVVPKKPDSFQGREINVEFCGMGDQVTLRGGICSDDVPISVSGIRFEGAGKVGATDQYFEKWPEGSANAGQENTALSGDAAANASGCVFTGYYYAMKLSTNIRLCGRNNHYAENHIAWYLGEGNEDGGNLIAEDCTFEENDIAIQIIKFNLKPSFYAPSRCRFLNNKLDIENNSGKTWFIPGNYFEHGTTDGSPRLATAIHPATRVNCYPMCKREWTTDGEYKDTFYYDYKQLDREEIAALSGYRLSNDLTGKYPIPADHLTGKTFAVVNEENDATLATFAFAAPEQQAARARRSIALFSAEQEGAFDATVQVDRSEEGQIVFRMNDPCKPVTVTLPCTFQTGTVTHSGERLSGVTFDGETVSFQTSEPGEYIISQGQGLRIAAGYDKNGRLIGLRFLSDTEKTAEFPGAQTVKIFSVDQSFRPIGGPQSSSIG